MKRNDLNNDEKNGNHVPINTWIPWNSVLKKKPDTYAVSAIVYIVQSIQILGEEYYKFL